MTPSTAPQQAHKSCPSDLVRVARRKLDQLNHAAGLSDLCAPPSNRLEKLKVGDYLPEVVLGE